jgi:hypothetical protein
MKNTGIIGLTAGELGYVRLLIGFLRHPDPVVAETARQALAYLENLGSRSEAAKPPKPQHLNRFHNQKE